MGRTSSPDSIDLWIGLTLAASPVCFTIDVERDFRSDGKFGVRGVTDGLPSLLDVLKNRAIPFDLMVSTEVAPFLPQSDLWRMGDLMSLGCHGNNHALAYLNRLSSATQERDIRVATEIIRRTYNRAPLSFRAPNFSANGRTIRILKSLGYAVDSSVLPGRWVKKWKVFPLVDHRDAPEDPYFTDAAHFPHPGLPEILEIPVTRNRALPGGPLGLGYLHSHGVDAFRAAWNLNSSRYTLILGHSWEMVSWGRDDPVAPWVRKASASGPALFADLVEASGEHTFVNSETIVAAEQTRRLTQLDTASEDRRLQE